MTKTSKRLTRLTLAALLAAGLWWTASHADDVHMEARRIIVYSTTS
ncbi:hypothetical protein [Cohnella candidum]|nr:hypothetical protein [Cohnella candidum]